MGKTLKIHPLTIIFILLCAGNLMGIVGVIIGIPLYAVLKVLVSHIFMLFKRRYNRYYGNDAGEYTITEEEKELNNNIYNFRLEQQNNNVPVFLFLNHIHLQS